MQVLRYILEGCAILIMISAAFLAGSFLQRQKMLDEWRRVEQEWEDFDREKKLWRSRQQK